MSHFGNSPIELVEQVEMVKRHIGDQSFTTTTIDHDGRWRISIHLANWRGRSLLGLFWESVGLLWRAMK